ncbi:hypothetical protein HFP43_24805 [Streptomyces sp. SJ1-7]|nr:hypothetical protein [Streptomyces sp. SJ1-7]
MRAVVRLVESYVRAPAHLPNTAAPGGSHRSAGPAHTAPRPRPSVMCGIHRPGTSSGDDRP